MLQHQHMQWLPSQSYCSLSFKSSIYPFENTKLLKFCILFLLRFIFLQNTLCSLRVLCRFFVIQYHCSIFLYFHFRLLPIVHSGRNRYNRPQNDIADWQLPQTSEYCSSHNWFTPRQRKLCELHPSLLPSVMEGAMEAIRECRYQFKNHRWNCPVSNVTAVFGRSKLRTSKYKHSHFEFSQLSPLGH